ncbi:MAG TPA: hypothetical protein VM008_11065 [Phycisphaerae bacterium]|nr:hypothetical protein [Phycisphaerae bacterium]
MRIATIFLLTTLSLTACAPASATGESHPGQLARNPDTLLAILASTSTPDESRQHADALLVRQSGKGDPARLAVLEQLLYAPGHSDAMRIYAMDQLADASPARAGHALELYLPRFEGPVLDHGCQLAVTLGDARLIAPLARSLAQTVKVRGQAPEELRARPEWAAIQKLAGKDPAEAMYDLINSSTDQSARIAALDVLHVLQSPDAIAARLGKMERHDPWLDDLRWYLGLFNTPPVGATESLWMMYLHRPEFAALVARAAEHHRLLLKNPDYVFAPRFIAVLAYTDDATITAGKARLLAELSQRLATLAHVNRTPQYEGAPDDIDESLKANEQKLSLCDLFAIRLLLNGLSDSANIAELHRQGLDDLSDTTTEHGGLLSLQDINSPRLLMTLYPPYYASNDFEYISSDKLLEQTAAGIAEYHFHFQEIHNADRAGPGTGDLGYVRAQHLNGVVITSIDTRKINIDYYTPDGAVVDLGVYEVK